MLTTIQKYSLQTISWLIIYFYPSFGFLLLVGFFVVADTITGVAAAYHRGEALTSRRFRGVFPKYIVYGVAVFVAHVIQIEFLPDFPATKLVAGLIAYSELMSIEENIKDITGVSLFKFFIKKLKK